MSPWILWRLLKFVSLALFVAGAVGQLQATEPEGRLRWLNRAVLPGYLGLSAAGWMMAKTLDVSMGAPWITGTLVCSLVALWGMLRSVTLAPSWLSRAMSLGGLCGSLGFMVVRPENQLALLPLSLIGSTIGCALGAWAPDRGGPPSREQVNRAFRVVAVLEGSSLLLMMAINMPLKKLAGISIDGNTGLIGWTHGIMVFVYLLSLGVTARALGWGLGRVIVAFLASLVPGGAFVFERWLHKQEERAL